jgi:hypothetical protein
LPAGLHSHHFSMRHRVKPGGDGAWCAGRASQT